MKKILTIVIPAYNVEKYLNQTLKSLVEEDILNDIEVLVVDDGSKDGTAAIAKEYEKRFPESFRLISKENGGHGSTINKGIELARGSYFKVVDGDDWVNTEGFAKLVKALRKCDADYVVTNYYEVNDATMEKVSKDFYMLEKECVMTFQNVGGKVFMPMHALVIKTCILKDRGIRLDENCFYVDVEYVLYPIPYIHKIVYLDLYVYMYRLAVATQSVSMKGFQKHMQNHVDVILHLIDFLNDYKCSDGESEKVSYISKRIAQMIDDQVSIFLSFPSTNRNIKKQFKEFDNIVKQKNGKIYQMSGEYRRVLQILRKTNFKGYYIIKGLSNVRNRK